jgi:hypothetical protein
MLDFAGHSSSKEKLWQDFFLGPLEQWDNQNEKVKPTSGNASARDLLCSVHFYLLCNLQSVFV